MLPSTIFRFCHWGQPGNIVVIAETVRSNTAFSGCGDSSLQIPLTEVLDSTSSVQRSSTHFKFQSNKSQLLEAGLSHNGVQWSNPCTTSMGKAFKTSHLKELNQNYRPRKAQFISFGFVSRFMWKNVGPYSAKCFNPNCWVS